MSNPDLDFDPERFEEEVVSIKDWISMVCISALLVRVPPPTVRHKQETPVLGRFAEHKRMP